MRKAFLRTPVDFTRISSKFNPNRKHPILNTTRPHRGVDYAAPTGTPIKTAGDGKVVFAGTKGGYGKTVIVQHGERYSTLYAHLSRIKSGMKTGKRVSQGQTIGYVGSTGYATGPHLHYEFRVNGVHMNPLTVKLPHAEPLSAKYMDAFKQQSQPLLAQLDGLVPALAANQ
jgi:murein DD-endopeptidase MepM/ murein hydrolase activator NlpD